MSLASRNSQDAKKEDGGDTDFPSSVELQTPDLRHRQHKDRKINENFACVGSNKISFERKAFPLWIKKIPHHIYWNTLKHDRENRGDAPSNSYPHGYPDHPSKLFIDPEKT